MTLTYFTVQQFAEAVVSHDDTIASGADPNVEVITAILTFTPSVSEIVLSGATPPVLIRMQPILGRLDTDGNLKAIDSEPVYYLSGSTRNPCPAGLTPVFGDSHDPLYWVDSEGDHTANPAGTPIYGVRLVADIGLQLANPLTYKVDYSKTVYDAQANLPINSLRFTAPDSDVVIDLSTVTRIAI
jgi:hypothetical protein